MTLIDGIGMSIPPLTDGTLYQKSITVLAKPFRPKRQIKKPCPLCHQPICAGDAAVRKFFKGKVYWHYTTYHWACWIKVEKDLLERKIIDMGVWFEGNPYRPKQMVSLRSSGIAYEEVRRLKALRRYHNKKGHKDRVVRLTDTINKLGGNL